MTYQCKRLQILQRRPEKENTVITVMAEFETGSAPVDDKTLQQELLKALNNR